ncbi:MAG: class I SAM-dependent methyltransferase [Acidimicrobiia bacterium]|nr:class I SAM-dependent methyltransferase [Acidimicrobiia bacterium]
MDRDDWNERHGDPERDHPSLDRPNRFLVDVVEDLPAGDALDLAAGRGRNALWLAERGWSVTAVDWSDVGLDMARRAAAERGVALRVQQADLAVWEPSGTHDLVLIAYLHVPRPLREAVWKKASRAVAPGGRLVVIGHDPDNLTRGWGGPDDPAVHYGADEVAAVVGDDLDVERAEQVLRPVEDRPGVEAVDNVVVARRPG